MTAVCWCAGTRPPRRPANLSGCHLNTARRNAAFLAASSASGGTAVEVDEDAEPPCAQQDVLESRAAYQPAGLVPLELQLLLPVPAMYTLSALIKAARSCRSC